MTRTTLATRRRWRPLLSVLLVAVLVGCAGGKQPTRIQRDVLANARRAAEAGDHQAAAQRYRSLARAGVPRAQRELARLYVTGKGVPRDPEKAVHWFRTAAENGDVPAMRALAGMLLAGEGTPRNTVAAASWYRLAAEKGDLSAMHRLGRLLLAGEEGVAADPAAAARLLREAAARGHLPAQLELADALAEGRLTEREPGEARRWYARALATLERQAATGDARAAEQLGRRYAAGKGVPRSVRRAVAYLERAVESGRENVRVRLARLYRDGGPDMPPDGGRAVRHYTIAAERGEAKAAYELARLYLAGAPGLEPDGESAAYYFRLAAERGETRAFVRLGDLLADPALPPTDAVAARHWYLQAGLAGDAKGFYRLGRIDEKAGRIAKAFVWYRLAADAGHEKAERRTARLLRRMDPATVETAAVELARFRQRNGLAPAAGPLPPSVLESPPVRP